MSRHESAATEIAVIVRDALRAQGWKDGAEVAELEARLRAAKEALRDVDAFLADPAGHPLDAINQARKRIRAAVGGNTP